jgi:hypothetical protein
MGANATNAEIITLDVIDTLKTDGQTVTSLDTVEVVTTTNTLTAAESGRTYILNSATAFVTTLPVAAAGLRFKFYCGATEVTGGNHTIVPNSADDNEVHGQCIVAGAVVAAADEGSINLIADKFIQGDWVEVFSDGTSWYVSGQVVTSAGCTFTT